MNSFMFLPEFDSNFKEKVDEICLWLVFIAAGCKVAAKTVTYIVLAVLQSLCTSIC